MNDKRQRRWDRIKDWLRENSNWALGGGVLTLVLGVLALVLAGVQTYQGRVAIGNMAEQQRVRLSFGIGLEEIDDPVGIRIVMPLEIGGATIARHVTFKNYVTSDQPRQRDYISSVDVDWDSRDGDSIGDVDPTEKGRRIVGQALSPKQIETIISKEESLYFIARLEYCDIQRDCHYFMRCAELG